LSNSSIVANATEKSFNRYRAINYTAKLNLPLTRRKDYFELTSCIPIKTEKSRYCRRFFIGIGGK